MNAGDAEATVRLLVDCINRHDAPAIVGLCTQDHVLIDSLGSKVGGLEGLERAWNGYFTLFPDYRIEVEALTSAGGVVLMSGWASGSLRGSSAAWRIPAAWRASIVGGRIAVWQVYADNKPVYDLLGRDAQQSAAADGAARRG